MGKKIKTDPDADDELADLDEELVDDQEVVTASTSEHFEDSFVDDSGVSKDDMWSWKDPESDNIAICHHCNAEIRCVNGPKGRSKEKIMRHLREVHGVGLIIYTCQHCSKTFKRKYKFKEHTCPQMYEVC